jgi:hypothetical protein
MRRERATVSENERKNANSDRDMRVLRDEELETVGGGHRSPRELIIVHQYDKASPVLS